MTSRSLSLLDALGCSAPGTLAEGLESPADVLDTVSRLRAEIREREARMMVCAAAWVDLHPVDSIDQAAVAPGTQGRLAIAGEGVPLVAEFCVAEFAAALGLSTDAGRHYLGAALETRHRLPRLWARLIAGEAEPWKVRRVADHTIALPVAGAAWVDRQVTPLVDKLGPVRLQRIIDEAVRSFDPETYADLLAAQLEARYLTIEVDHASGAAATISVSGSLDLLDGFDLKNAVDRRAAERLAHGDTSPLAVRRSKALADLARMYAGLALDLPEPGSLVEPGERQPHSVVEPGERQRAGVETTTTSPPRTRRQVELVVHLHATGSRYLPFDPFARIDTPALRDITVLTDQLLEWLARPGTALTVRPVLDLDQHLHTPGYAPSGRLKRQTWLVNRSCVFPHCTRPADACDTDHVHEHTRGGTTCSCNLAPLCRRHHRLKTHSAWAYTPLDAGTYLWRSPHGVHLVRDRDGTTRLDTSEHDRHPPRP